MTTEEKYIAALERARNLRESKWQTMNAKRVVDEIFPELAETEDERIIEKIIDCLNRAVDVKFITLTDRRGCLDYLERQKEQKPNIEICPHSIKSKSYLETGYPIEQKPAEVKDPSREELEAHNKVLHNFKVFAAKQAKEHHISFVHDFEWNNFCGEILSYFYQPAEWSYQPAEWSEEDEDMRWNVISIVGKSKSVQAEEMVSWLKSLRNRPRSSDTWKPSEEQMEALKEAADMYWEPDGFGPLDSLYNDLKKLM